MHALHWGSLQHRSANQEANDYSLPFITALIIMLLLFLVLRLFTCYTAARISKKRLESMGDSDMRHYRTISMNFISRIRQFVQPLAALPDILLLPHCLLANFKRTKMLRKNYSKIIINKNSNTYDVDTRSNVQHFLYNHFPFLINLTPIHGN
jgi:hypothetical protein